MAFHGIGRVGRGFATFPPVAARCRLWGWAEDSPRCRPLSPVGAGGVPMIRCVPARCRSVPPVGVGRRFAAFPPVGAGRGFATFPLVAARCRLWGWAEDSPRSRPLPLIRHDPARCRLWGSHGFCSETRPPLDPSTKLRRPRATAGVTYRGYVLTVDGKCCSRSIHHRHTFLLPNPSESIRIFRIHQNLSESVRIPQNPQGSLPHGGAPGASRFPWVP